MNFGKGKETLELLLGNGKAFDQLDPVLQARLIFAINMMEAAASVEDLRSFGRFNLKFFNGQYQINVDPEKRTRFTVEGDTVLVTFFGSTTHKGE